ncbi:MFS transporter [Mesorhizobium sp. 10J20-29]
MSKPQTAQSAVTVPEAAVKTPPVGWALAGLSLSMLLSSLGTSIANVALPTLAEAFAASFQQVQWVVLAYLLAITTLIVSAGRLGDIFGHRRVMLAGIAVFTAASLLSGISPALPMLIAARAVQGAGAAVMMALTIGLVRSAVARERTGSAMGLLGTMSAVGTALGPSLGGLLLAATGWQAIFLVNVPLGTAAFWLALKTLPADRRRDGSERPGFDGLGTLLLALGLGAYALATTAGGGHFGLLNAALIAAAVLAVGLFVLAQKKVASPLVRLSALREASLSASLAMNGLVSTVMMATLVVGPFYLSSALGLSTAMTGLVLSIGPVISALSGVPAGRMVDRLQAQPVVTIGLVAMAAGCVALALLPPIFGLAGYIAAIAVMTPGYQLFQAANNTAVMSDVKPDERGVISGLLILSRNVGLITGASVMGAVFAFAASVSDIRTAKPAAMTTGMQVTFAVAAVLVGVAFAIWMASRAGTARAPTPDAP